SWSRNLQAELHLIFGDTHKKHKRGLFFGTVVPNAHKSKALRQHLTDTLLHRTRVPKPRLLAQDADLDRGSLFKECAQRKAPHPFLQGSKVTRNKGLEANAHTLDQTTRKTKAPHQFLVATHFKSARKNARRRHTPRLHFTLRERFD